MPPSASASAQHSQAPLISEVWGQTRRHQNKEPKSYAKEVPVRPRGRPPQTGHSLEALESLVLPFSLEQEDRDPENESQASQTEEKGSELGWAWEPEFQAAPPRSVTE